MTTKLRHLGGGTSAAVSGAHYDADENGHIHVDNGNHVAILTAHPHNWQVVVEPPPPPEPAELRKVDLEPELQKTGEPEKTGAEDDDKVDPSAMTGEEAAAAAAAAQESGGTEEQ